MRAFSVCCAIVFGMSFCAVRADGPAVSSPILVELFTSEGCSSCPSADTLLQKLDASQPIPGGQLIVLSEHVDYWDRDGWKDPFSSPLLSERQRAYGRALRMTDTYTPQIIIDGSGELRPNDPGISEIFQKAAASPKIPVHVGAVSVVAGTPQILLTRVEADADAEKHNADVYLAIALDHAESHVASGENSGRVLTHVAVVESIKKIGRLEKGKSFGLNIQAKLKPGTDPANLRVIAFVQETGTGKVLGAALHKDAAR